jgi:glutamine amidotransferase
MWHARYATHGVKNEANCHPFQVGGSDLTYLAHNGILDVDIPQGDKRSDTRVFAEDILPQFGGVSALDNGTIWNMVSSWASGSKIAVLTVDPSAQYEMYLVNEKLGYWDDGVWFSNNACKIYPTVAKSYWQTPTATDKQLVVIEYNEETDTYNPDITYCLACESIVDMEENPFNCPNCDACLDCTQTIADCLCYHPAWKQYYSQRSFEDMLD